MQWLFYEQTGDARCRRELLGALIGLARATDGNAHMLSESTGHVTAEALAALDNKDADPQVLTLQVREEKRKLVPECFRCASPCGRNQEFDVSAVGKEREGIRMLKGKILSAICELTSCGRPVEATLLYRALFCLGCDDWEEEDLRPLLREVEAAAGIN